MVDEVKYTNTPLPKLSQGMSHHNWAMKFRAYVAVKGFLLAIGTDRETMMEKRKRRQK